MAVEELQLAIESGDNKLVEQLDGKISTLFEQIFQASPSDKDDVVLMIEFLLEHLLDFDKGSASSERIKTRILFLAKMTF